LSSPAERSDRARGRNRAWIAPALAVGILVGPAACGQAPSSLGTVSGMAAPCIGVSRPGQASVTVYARQHGRVVASRRVVLTSSRATRYRLRLAPGAYIISAPRAYLPGRPVTVLAGRTVTVNFLPSCK
jgi:hypothetical protein